MSHRLQLDEVALDVRVEGQGPAVLLLHGFPDSHAVWRRLSPLLVAAGHTVIAPDLRGYGASDAPRGRAAYRIDRLTSDVIQLLDALQLSQVHLAGHDWGAVIAWVLAGRNPGRFHSLTALSVGHPTAYARAGWEQKRKGWYTLLFQLPWLPEWMISRREFRHFRQWLKGYPETDRWIADLSRPGRLTAALNWYRANIFSVLFQRHPNSGVPTLGIWSTRDIALAEGQMTASSGFVDAPWTYERYEGNSHWIPLEAPEKLCASMTAHFARALQTDGRNPAD